MDRPEPNIPEKFLKPYDAKGVEAALYERWESAGYFNPDVCIEKGIAAPDAPTYSIMLPPPNVTGTLHMGHASMLAIQDILVRHARMKGMRTLWLPGTDHAAIATQSKVEKELQKKEKVSRRDLGRAEFLKRVDEFAQESHDTIVNQVRAMGSSVDWSREAFTLDDARRLAVNTAFKNMYDAGLIVQGDRMVNWDPKGQTVISDDEIVYEEEKTTFYYFQYGPFVIGTARPETKFGDKYAVLHPDDARYAEYQHGHTIDLEWINGPITATIIKDDCVDPEFGSGVMTITPWHSAVDFAIAERHTLDKEQVIDQYGKLLPIAGEFAGMKIAEAREKIVEKLRAKGLVVKEEAYTHNVATAERTGAVIEPQIMKQWFIAVEKPFTIPYSEIPGIPSGSTTTLKDIMRKAVAGNAIQILPDRFLKTYHHWIDNLHDWCISRQIWYGHRIPVWYKGSVIYVGIDAPEGEGWEQDSDTLDTWFSSGLWTFSTLGWPEKTPDLEAYHPTTVLETGYDILFFWVARMILMTGFHMGTIPFRYVYLHGLVRDTKGRKMSKSLGNIIDPLEMIEKYGADATRLSLIAGTQPGNDLKLDEARIRGYKHFANKIWNIARFVLTSTDGAAPKAVTYTAEDATLAEARDTVIAAVDTHLNDFRLDLALDAIYHYTWDVFAADIIESSKPIINGDDSVARESRQQFLYETLVMILKTLHPFMPFVTEEIWSSLPQTDRDMLIGARWPNA